MFPWSAPLGSARRPALHAARRADPSGITEFSLIDGTIHPDRGALPALCAHREKQAVRIGHEQRGACAGAGGDARKPREAGIARIEHIDEAVPATHVDALSLRIQE